MVSVFFFEEEQICYKMVLYKANVRNCVQI